MLVFEFEFILLFVLVLVIVFESVLIIRLNCHIDNHFMIILVKLLYYTMVI